MKFTCPKPWLFGMEITVQPDQFGVILAETNDFAEPVWKLTATSAVTNIGLRADSQQIVYRGSVSAGSVLTVDSRLRETRLNGFLKVVEVAGTYPMLHATNMINVSPGVTVSTTYRARWI
jgi:hypothetical protein